MACLARRRPGIFLPRFQEKAMYAPIWQLAFLSGVGPRVGESCFGLIPGFAYTAPFEDLTLKSA